MWYVLYCIPYHSELIKLVFLLFANIGRILNTDNILPYQYEYISIDMQLYYIPLTEMNS